MKRVGKKHSAAFKAKLAVAAIRGDRTIAELAVHFGVQRSALPTGCAFPASRASSEGGEMLAFAHIPTGTATNNEFDID